MAGQTGIPGDNEDLTLDEKIDEALALLRDSNELLREVSQGLVDLISVQRSTNGMVGDFLQNLTIENVPGEELDALSDLPVNIPKRDTLIGAGILRLAELPRTLRGLLKIDGIEHEDAMAILRMLSPTKD